MRNDRTRADASATPRRVQVGEAAELLGISEGAVRMRVEDGTLDSTREGGRLYVLLHGDPTGEPTRPHARTNELIATLREQLEAELRFVRGGTDGSHLSERGLPTPNIFTGGHDCHSRHEWTYVGDMGRPSRRAST